MKKILSLMICILMVSQSVFAAGNIRILKNLGEHLGIGICFVAFCLMLFYAGKAIFLGDPVSGFPTLISVILMLGGLQLLCLGILGQYLAKTYLETKGRPIYIIGKTNIER